MMPVLAGAQSLSGRNTPCKGETITRIDIRRRGPFEVRGTAFWQRAARFASRQHVTTREPVVRRFLALRLGDTCTELRKAESERILRAQPFLADAAVTTYPDGSGGMVLDVSTVDEVSLIIGGGVSGKSPHLRAVRLGEANLGGGGVYVMGEWKHGAFFRDIYAGKFTHYQFLGRPYQLSIRGGRRELGSDWASEVSHPFLSDLQRLSWRTTVGSGDRYFYFVRPEALPAALKSNREYGDIGGVIRVGPPAGRVALLGGSISHEREMTARAPVIVTIKGLRADTSTALINKYSEHTYNRVNALWGARHVSFLRVNGFDALAGSQDVRTGWQVATLLGKGLQVFGGDQSDWFSSAELYGGMGSRRAFAAIDVTGEGRHSGGKWDGLLMHGRAAAYVKPIARNTLISDVTWSAGLRQRVPFQLTLFDPDDGVRGFRRSDIGGGRRVITRLEDRYLLPRWTQFGTLGLAGFVDAGKLWAGDVPFGVNSRTSVGVGVSLLAALPSQSRRLWRIDVAYPVTGDRKGGVEVRFSNRDYTRIFRREPGDIYSSRERSVPSSVFNWP